MSVCRRARFWGPGGGGRRDGDSGVEPSKRHHSSAGCHEAGPTRLCHVTHLLAPSAPQFHSEPRRPRKARVRRDFKSNVNTRVSSSFPFSVLLASPETLITPGNNRGNSWSTGAPPKLRPLCSSKVQSASLRFRTIHDAFPDSHKLFQAGCVSGWGRGGGGQHTCGVSSR